MDLPVRLRQVSVVRCPGVRIHSCRPEQGRTKPCRSGATEARRKNPLAADATRRKRPQLRQYFRLLVPAYKNSSWSVVRSDTGGKIAPSPRYSGERVGVRGHVVKDFRSRIRQNSGTWREPPKSGDFGCAEAWAPSPTPRRAAYVPYRTNQAVLSRSSRHSRKNLESKTLRHTRRIIRKDGKCDNSHN